jgi:hypothetical protein
MMRASADCTAWWNMTSTADLQKIANAEDFSWIKVRRYVKNESKSAEDQLADFEQHHLKEMTFLLNKCREFAQKLLDHRDHEE